MSSGKTLGYDLAVPATESHEKKFQLDTLFTRLSGFVSGISTSLSMLRV